MPRQHLGLLLAGLAAGDSLGSTSEFSSLGEALDLYRKFSSKGWPFAHVGGGRFEWGPGQPTEDTEMAVCMVRSFLAHDVFDPEDFAGRLV